MQSAVKDLKNSPEIVQGLVQRIFNALSGSEPLAVFSYQNIKKSIAYTAENPSVFASYGKLNPIYIFPGAEENVQ